MVSSNDVDPPSAISRTTHLSLSSVCMRYCFVFFVFASVFVPSIYRSNIALTYSFLSFHLKAKKQAKLYIFCVILDAPINFRFFAFAVAPRTIPVTLTFAHGVNTTPFFITLTSSRARSYQSVPNATLEITNIIVNVAT